MSDKDMEVLEGRRKLAPWYIDARQKKEECEPDFVITRREPVIAAGATGLYTPTQAKKFSLCQLIREGRSEVAQAYQLPVSSLREDPLGGRRPVARHIEVRGTVTRALAEMLQRRIRREVGQGANLIFLQLKCGGGDAQAALDLGHFLSQLKDDNDHLPVMTVAYIPERAPDTATFIALGCTEIAIGPKAELGDFESYHGRGGAGKEELIRQALVDLARVQGYSPLLFQGMLDRKLTVYLVQSQKGRLERRLITKEEWDADQAGKKKWRELVLITAGGADGRLLKLSGTQAYELGVAQTMVEDLPSLYEHYDVKGIRDIGPAGAEVGGADEQKPTTLVVRSVPPPDLKDSKQERSAVLRYGLTLNDFRRFKVLGAVDHLVPLRLLPQEVQHQQKTCDARLVATTEDYAKANRFEMAAGRFLKDTEDQFGNVIVLSAAVVKELFPTEGQQSVVGQSVSVNKQAYKVVGVIKERPSQKTAHRVEDFDKDMYIPITTSRARFGESILMRQRGKFIAEQVELHQIIITVADPELTQPLAKVIRDLLSTYHNKQDWEVAVR